MRTKLRAGIVINGVLAGALLASGASVLAQPATQPTGGQVLAGPRAFGAPTTQPNGSFSGQRRNNVLVEFLESLNVTPEQRATLRPILKQFQDDARAFRSAHATEIASLTAQAKEARQSGDRSAARSVRQQLQALRESAPKPKDLANKIRAVLTAAQQATFDAKIEEVLAKMRGQGRRPGAMQGTTQPNDAGMSGMSGHGGATTQPAAANADGLDL